MATNADRARWAREYRKRKKLGLPQPKRGANLLKHGVTHSPEHRSWLSMMTRCLWSGPERPDYALYQGKGITVCERWLDFANFLADMGPKPTPKHTLDRIDSDGNYEPNNCKWSTAREQARNWKRRNFRIAFRGESLLTSEWAERIGITRESLRDRLNGGWSVERALTTPAIRERDRHIDGTFAKASSD
jgi:hypothetical protein